MERVASLTAELRAKHPGRELAQFLYCVGKGALFGVDPSVTAQRFRAGVVPNILKSAVAAGSASGSTWGGSLSDWYTLTREWVRLVSAKTILGRLDAMRVPFQTKTVVEPGVTAQYARALPVASASLTNTAKLDRLPIGCVTVYTRELFETWAPGTEQNLLRVLERAISRGVDAAFIDVDSSAVAGERPASILNGVSPIGSLTNTATGALADLEDLLGAHIDAGSDGERIVLAMHPSTCLALSVLESSNGNRTFPNLGAFGGEVLGVPVVTSVACVRSGSPSEKIIAALDGGKIIVADDDGLELTTNTATSLQMDDAPTNDATTGTGTNMVSLFQTHSLALKAVRTLNFQRAHASAVAWMTSTF